MSFSRKSLLVMPDDCELSGLVECQDSLSQFAFADARPWEPRGCQFPTRAQLST